MLNNLNVELVDKQKLSEIAYLLVMRCSFTLMLSSIYSACF